MSVIIRLREWCEWRVPFGAAFVDDDFGAHAAFSIIDIGGSQGAGFADAAGSVEADAE